MTDPTVEELLERQRIQNMGLLVREFDGRPGELAAFLEKRFAGYIESARNPGEGDIAEANTWFPTVFGRFGGPVVGVSELYSEGRSALSDHPRMPGLIAVGWRAHYPSLTRLAGGKWKDGREEARDRCRPVADRFREALLSDEWLEARVEEVRVGRSEAADHDRMGNPYQDLASEGKSIIWVHAVTVEILL